MAAGAACLPPAGRLTSMRNLEAFSSASSSGLRRPLKNQQLLFLGTSISYGGSNRISRWMRRKGKVSSTATARPIRPVFSPVVMEWQECSSEIEIDVPCSVAYQCYSERETIPQWMPFISSVKVLEDKPDLSRWTLKYEVFGRDVEFSWLALNMRPIKNQKIHWRALEGLPNRGAVRFVPKSSSSCRVQLLVVYEVPQLLAPVASALKPFLERLLSNGLQRFAIYAKERQSKIPQR